MDDIPESIENLKKQLVDNWNAYFSKHKDNLPSFEERFQTIWKDARTKYASNAESTMDSAKFIADDIEFYLEAMWPKTSQARDLHFKLALKQMSPKELEEFNKIVELFETRKLPYDKLELANLREEQDLFDLLAKGKFTVGNYVIGHNYAYTLNSTLRRGVQVNDAIRVILDEGFKDVAPMQASSEVYRAIAGSRVDGSADYINRLVKAPKGATFTDLGYSYASFSPKCVGTCNATYELDVPIVSLTIKVPKGAKISDARWITEQHEMLFPRNAQFRVIHPARTITPPHYTEIGKGEPPLFIAGEKAVTLEYIPPKESI